MNHVDLSLDAILGAEIDYCSAKQGSAEWLAWRAERFGASEAAAMLGLSHYETRSALLARKATGIEPEHDEGTLRVFANGHAVEAAIRPHAEQIVGDDMSPMTCARRGTKIAASCDGLTLMREVAWENKQWNEELAAQVRAGIVPDSHMPQCQQVLLVTGAERLVFTVTKGTPEETVWCDVQPHMGWFELIVRGWHQFERDLLAYEPTPAAAPAPVGRAPETLPALRIEITGEVSASNLAEFKTTALAAIRSVNRDLTTDADFADAAKAVKWCEEVESKLKAAKELALSQTASIDALFKTMDDINAEARDVRLALTKDITRRKGEMRTSEVERGRRALAAHIAEIDAHLGGRYMPAPLADFALAIKGLKATDTMASIRNAIDTHLAQAKIAADSMGQRIMDNLHTLLGAGPDAQSLFSDRAALVLKEPETVSLIVAQRLAERKATEEKRLEAERERIRAEEAARLQREAAAAADRARIAAEEEARATAALAAQNSQRQESEGASALAHQTAVAPSAGAKAEGAAVASAAAAPGSRQAGAIVTIGALCKLVGPAGDFNITQPFLESLGVPVTCDKASKLVDQAAAKAALLKRISEAL